MAKTRINYCCQSCGYICHQWLGKCPACSEWNTLEEEVAAPAQADSSALSSVRQEFREDLKKGEQAWVGLTGELSPNRDRKTSVRLETGISELDRVMGGGVVSDSFTLLGGDPGIGKSTLLLQMASGLAEHNPHLKILYVSGEESVDQIRSRAKRLGIINKNSVFLAGETELERAFQLVKELRPNILLMDSLQTFSTSASQSAPGSVGQVREIAVRLMTLAKSAGIAVWLVGHVTKEGNIAGPKTVEHMVDTVLYFEGEGGYSYRLLRAVKNRFGNTRELGVFEMEGEGLIEVTNPSSLFLNQRTTSVSGTAVAIPLEGSRPLLVELQALVTPSGLAMPRRTSVGIEAARISLLAAILEKHLKLSLADRDLFFNVSGGLKLSEPACDLAAASAIWSSAKDMSLPHDWAYVGEVGLTGEVRRVSQMEMRLNEAYRLGFKGIVLPQSTPEPILERFRDRLKIFSISRIEELPRIAS